MILEYCAVIPIALFISKAVRATGSLLLSFAGGDTASLLGPSHSDAAWASVQHASVLCLSFMTAHLFQSRFAASETCWMIIRHFDESPLRVSQGYLVELVSDGKRRPGTPWLEAPLSASSVEMMDFAMFHLMSNTIRVRETYTKYTRRCLVSPTLETTSPACRRFSTSGFSVSFPTATVAINSPSASRLSSSHWRMSLLPSTTPPQTYDACRMSW